MKKARKAFFFEKKKQKAFISPTLSRFDVSWRTRLVQMRRDKSFLVLFFKKGLLSSLLLTLAGCNPSLSTSDVATIITHAIQAAQAKGVNATIAVTDRMGNVLGVWQMTGAAQTVQIINNPNGGNASDSLNGAFVPSVDAAISKAITASYLSSSGGNAFSTRTASQIVQDHFNPGTPNAPSGPLYGVQFSQLACSDLLNPPAGTTYPAQGVHPAPLGLSGDPGGLPLYKGGQLVGGIGVKASGPYGLDLNIHANDNSVDETIAASGATGYPAPASILANTISVGGLLLRYTDVPSNFASGNFPPATLASLPGGLVSVPGYFNAAGGLIAGNAYGDNGSGLIADTSGLFSTTKPPMVLVNANCPSAGVCQPRFPVIAGNGPDALSQAESLQILRSVYALSLVTRGQIRNPPGVTPAAVNMSMVDANGQILGIISDFDAPIFGIDVSLQKARSALFISDPTAAAQLEAAAGINVARYASEEQNFFGAPLNGNHAWSERAIGNSARDTYPDGIPGTPNGPFNLPASVSNPFGDGLQLDLVLNDIVGALGGTRPQFCTGLPLVAGGPGQRTQPMLANGLQIFPGGFPIYRNGTLVGGIGVSGDGVDQDDLIGFLGLYNAGQVLGTGVGHAPMDRRANLLSESGIAPVYVNCPFSPFLNSDAEDVCSGK